MEKQYSVKFFSSFIESLQNICQEHLIFEQVVEVSGYVCVEIDNARKERYVLSELIQSCGNVISESYCTKAYKNLPVAVRGKPKAGTSGKRLVEEEDDKENNSRKSESFKSCDDEIQHQDNPSEPKRRKSNPMPLSKSLSFLDKCKNTDLKKLVKKNNELGGLDRPRSSGSIGIESRSSSFLASAAKLCSTSSNDRHAEQVPGQESFQESGQESFQEFVSGVIDSLNSPRDHRSNSSTDNSCGADEDEETYLDLPKPTRKTSTSSSSKSSTHEIPGQSHLLATSGDHSSQSTSTKTPFSLSSLFRFKSKSKQSESKTATSKKSLKPSVESTCFVSSGQSQNMNISSLRHLVSKSYEDLTKLEQRKAGMENDIPHGQAYIELLEEGKEEEDEEDGEIISLEEVDTEAAPNKRSDVSEASTSCAGPEIPCTVTSSLMLEVGSISTVTSMEDADSSQLAISEEEDHGEQENLDSPIIIDLDSEDEGEEDNSSTGGDDQPYSNVEIRKLDTFKDYVKFAVKRFQAFIREKDMNEPIFRIPPERLDPLLAEFYVTVRNRRGDEFGVSTLKSIQSYLELYLRENGYPISITRDKEFSHCRSMLQTKIQQLREIHLKSLPPVTCGSPPLTRRDVDKLFRTQQLGDQTAESLTNSMWFMNSVLFKLNKDFAHCALKWGDVVLKVDEYQNEYLQLSPSNVFSEESCSAKVYPNNANPERCFLRLFKMFERMRPASTLTKKSPFYLTVDRQLNRLKDEKMNMTNVSILLRNMLILVGIQSDKKVVNYDIL